jgi:hypothetical protein
MSPILSRQALATGMFSAMMIISKVFLAASNNLPRTPCRRPQTKYRNTHLRTLRNLNPPVDKALNSRLLYPTITILTLRISTMVHRTAPDMYLSPM